MNSCRLRTFLFAILVGASLGAMAATPPPKLPFDPITWKATMKRTPSTGLRMGAFSVLFEKTTLDDVRRATSVGEIAHSGDAGASVYWLCYSNPRATRTERIWFVAHGEMGGREHHITGIAAELVPNGGASADCPELPRRLRPLSIDNYLWLGVSEGGIVAKLGAPSYRKDAWRSYDFQGKVSGNCASGGFDRSAWLLLHFQNGRINSLQAGQVTTC